MFRTFLIGIILGLLCAGAVAWYVPAVDLHRERSLVTVQTNGGNVEEFRTNLPRDRILVGSPNIDQTIPSGVDWPGTEYLGDMQAEMFKIRNRDDAVVGIGSRIASAAEENGPFVEWTLHFPARGTMFVRMDARASSDGHRNGVLTSGTRDFSGLSGSARERFVAGIDDESDVQGRIEIEVAVVGQAVEEE